jgi:hypothetical protein
MPITIEPYSENLIPAVRAFNQNLDLGGAPAEFRFPESNVPHWLPRIDGRRIFQQYYLAIDGESVRGGFVLKHQDFSLHRTIRPIVYYHLPISQGIINKSYASVGVMMLRRAIKREPMLFALGMGSFDKPLPVMLKALGWKLCAVPFYFRVVHPAKFLRQIAPLRSSVLRRMAAEVAALTGIGRLGVFALQKLRSRNPVGGLASEPITAFGSWADDLWQECASYYTLIASRDSATLNILYPANKNFICIRVLKNSATLGWAVMLDTQMRGNKYFGDLRVGTIVDCLALPENATAVLHRATELLARRGVDLVVANHSHAAWTSAFRSSGFLEGPSNFIFAASPPLTKELEPFEQNQGAIYFMRGDGDGPINL